MRVGARLPAIECEALAESTTAAQPVAGKRAPTPWLPRDSAGISHSAHHMKPSFFLTIYVAVPASGAYRYDRKCE